jgi:uncharacterized membrane protein
MEQENRKPEKNLELERMVFFSDAVVAIAITLLALDLKIERAVKSHLTFTDIAHSWKTFTAFGLSFLIIALFWKIHHQFFMFIKKMDQRLMVYNLCWLLFIVTLPFTTTLVSAYFFDPPAVFLYSLNIFVITCFQNLIWDHVSRKPEFVKETLTTEENRQYRVACNLAMINAIMAMGLAFLSPVIAFIILLTRTLMFRLSAINYTIRKDAKMAEMQRLMEKRKKQKVE